MTWALVFAAGCVAGLVFGRYAGRLARLVNPRKAELRGRLRAAEAELARARRELAEVLAEAGA